MGLIQPKPFLNKIKLRNKSIGTERRRNLSKIILEKGTPFPTPITYEDIDSAFIEWVKDGLEISCDGKRLPTYKLFSNQRISEYTQTWSQKDDSGNIVMNFKTITRENNPKKGSENGNLFNIPGDRFYNMFCVPTLQENGTEAYDLYQMRQPFNVDFIFTLSIVTNKYELLNRFNEKVLNEFKSLQKYISINGHNMPMTLLDISDESDYSIDDRKYYSQSYKISLRAYIIREEDFRVISVPSRVKINVGGNENRKNRVADNVVDTGNVKFHLDRIVSDNPCIDDAKIVLDKSEETAPHVEINCVEEKEVLINGKKPSEVGKVYNNPDYYDEYFVEDPNEEKMVDDDTITNTKEEDYIAPDCCIEKEESPYKHKVMRLIINFPLCVDVYEFALDTNMNLDEIKTENVYDFIFKINGENVDFEKEVKIKNGDILKIKLSRDDVEQPSSVILEGYDPDVIYDSTILPESSLDEDINEEEIIVNAE